MPSYLGTRSSALMLILLAVMALCSYVFVNRSLDHQHRVEENSLKRDESGGQLLGYKGRTSLNAYHRHDVLLDAESEGATADDLGAISNFGHSHSIQVRGDGHLVLHAEGIMQARVPRWGRLRFLDRQGVAKERGINVGNEWTYRSFIDGNSQASPTWRFRVITRRLFPKEVG